MKTALLLALSCISLNAELLKLDMLKTAKGKTYQDVSVTEKRPDGISIRHAAGTARIPFEDIPADVRKKLGGFDEDAAEEAREADAAKLRAAERAMDEAEAAKEEAPEDTPETDDTEAPPAEEGAAKIEPKNIHKLTVKLIGTGTNRRSEITVRSGALPLFIRYGPGKYDHFTVPAWETLTRVVTVSKGYPVTASENGQVVDTEGSTKKTGLGSDTKLR